MHISLKITWQRGKARAVITEQQRWKVVTQLKWKGSSPSVLGGREHVFFLFYSRSSTMQSIMSESHNLYLNTSYTDVCIYTYIHTHTHIYTRIADTHLLEEHRFMCRWVCVLRHALCDVEANSSTGTQKQVQHLAHSSKAEKRKKSFSKLVAFCLLPS